MVIISLQSGVYFEKGKVASFKWLINVLNNDIRFYFLDILTQDILKK